VIEDRKERERREKESKSVAMELWKDGIEYLSASTVANNDEFPSYFRHGKMKRKK
jgi:hypothetical protein